MYTHVAQHISQCLHVHLPLAGGLPAARRLSEALLYSFPCLLVMVHLVRNSLRYVSHKHIQAVATDLKAIYSSATEEEAELNLELKAFEMGWIVSQYQQVLAHPVGPGDPAVCLSRRHPMGHLYDERY